MRGWARSVGFGLLVLVTGCGAGLAAPSAGAQPPRHPIPGVPTHTPIARSLTGATALLPAPKCPVPPRDDATPWLDPQYGATCQAQFVIDNIETPSSPLYAHGADGAPAQTVLTRLEAAYAEGTNLEAANGSSTNLLALYGLTATGATATGAVGEPTGLAFPSALTIGASFTPGVASDYGTMLGSEFHRTGKNDVLGPALNIVRSWHTGREMEFYSEDPFLTGSMVGPEIRAIQAQGVMTTVKHGFVYTQEQGRTGLALSLTTPKNTGENQLVSERAIEEIYGPAWQAAVSPAQGNGMSVMCSYPIIDAKTPPPYKGQDSCGNKFFLNDLLKGQYGFQGTYTPDAVTAERDAPALNFVNGADGPDARLTLAQLASIVGNGTGDQMTNADGTKNLVSEARLVDEVRRIVLQSVKNERFANPPTTAGIGNGIAADAATSAAIEEQGAVLLKDSAGALPISSSAHSIAVIGTQAGPNDNATVGPVTAQKPQVENVGSPYVSPNTVFTTSATGQKYGYVSALAGIETAAGQLHQTVTFAPGWGGLAQQPALSSTGSTSGQGSIVTPTGTHAGFLATYYGGNDPTTPSDPVLGTQIVPSVQYDTTKVGTGGPTSFPAVGSSPAVTIPSQYQFNQWSTSYQGTYTPPVTGNYQFSITQSGTTKLYVDGKLVAQRVRDDFGDTSNVDVPLQAGHPVSIVVDYSPEEAAAAVPSAVPIFTARFNTFLGDEVHLGVTLPPSTGPSLIAQAAQAAAHASVAVVVVGRTIGEGHDTEKLSLPGDQNQLIEAVAKANPHTVVVLTGGQFTMPWLTQVSAVLEMWEPGATFGTALASLLYGKSDPSGKLPVTFPASPTQGLGSAPAQYPGLTTPSTGASNDYRQLKQEIYSEGVDVGYRYFEVHHQTPLFPFGYGLSYTSFQRRLVGTHQSPNGDVTVTIADTNTGTLPGADVVEGYVHDPPSTGEPPEQLRAFQKVELTPGQTKNVTLRFRPSSFAYWNSGPATGTTPGVTSPSAVGQATSPEPAGRWVIAPGTYGISIGDSLSNFYASTSVHLSGEASRGSLDGLFAWTLGPATPTITHHPASPTASTTAAFAFSDATSSASFECSLDNGRPAPCASGVTYTDLSAGTHTFSVEAVSPPAPGPGRALGRTQPAVSVPASFSWTITGQGPTPRGPAPRDHRHRHR